MIFSIQRPSQKVLSLIGSSVLWADSLALTEICSGASQYTMPPAFGPIDKERSVDVALSSI